LTSISCRARTSKNRQRGFVLITAIILAVLYFALMELLLIESSRSLAEAQRFRARVVAATLAENAAELTALQLVNGGPSAPLPASDDQGTMSGSIRRSGNEFEIDARGSSSGVISQTSTVYLRGSVNGSEIAIEWAKHDQ
jgi:Tfp pilus assembly protein PilV